MYSHALQSVLYHKITNIHLIHVPKIEEKIVTKVDIILTALLIFFIYYCAYRFVC